MKKFILFVVAVLLLATAVAAQGPKQVKGADVAPEPTLYQEGQGTGQGTQEQAETMTQEQNKGEETQVQGPRPEMIDANLPAQAQGKLGQGQYQTAEGKMLQVEQKTQNKLMLKSGSAEAETSMEMTQEQTQEGTKLKVKLSNGKNAEVKVMPDTASEKALERLRLKVCSSENNCTIELKETGTGNDAKPVYEMTAQREAKILGFIKTKMQVQAQVDAENGEIVRVKKKWWAFLASEPEE